MRTVTKVLYAMHVPVDTRQMHRATPAADLEVALEAAREEPCAGEGGARITGWELPVWSRDPHDRSGDTLPFIDEPERRKIRDSDVWPRPGCVVAHVRFIVEATSGQSAQTAIDEALERANLGHLHGQSAFWRDPDRTSTLTHSPDLTAIYTYHVGPGGPVTFGSASPGPGL